MLKDELQPLRSYLAGSIAICPRKFEMLCTAIREKWMAAAFSGSNDDSLGRYFNFHLSGLAELAGVVNTNSLCVEEPICHLMEDLMVQYHSFIDLKVPAPGLFVSRFLLRQGSLDLPAEGKVGRWLNAYIDGLKDQLLTFEQLDFISVLLTLFNGKKMSEDALMEQLVMINFNHLGLLKSITGRWSRSDRTSLQMIRSAIRRLPVKKDQAFDGHWMSLKEMLVCWIDEEISVMAALSQNEITHSKLNLNIPVSHLGYFLRLFQDEGITAAPSLAELFRMVCSGIATKRQPLISEGSLSNEFYGTDQQTAARVRDVLQRMIIRIDLKYFPS